MEETDASGTWNGMEMPGEMLGSSGDGGWGMEMRNGVFPPPEEGGGVSSCNITHHAPRNNRAYLTTRLRTGGKGVNPKSVQASPLM